MIALIQRVRRAEVRVDGASIGKIDQGLLALVAIEKGDSDVEVQKMGEKLLAYRIFSDKAGKMNLNVQEVEGGLLLVSQFTLAADTRKGLRPSFTPAAAPEEGRKYFDRLVAFIESRYAKVQTGQFGADMQVELINDGPVTFHLRIEPSPSL